MLPSKRGSVVFGQSKPVVMEFVMLTEHILSFALKRLTMEVSGKRAVGLWDSFSVDIKSIRFSSYVSYHKFSAEAQR